jgi:hypothetical protein
MKTVGIAFASVFVILFPTVVGYLVIAGVRSWEDVLARFRPPMTTVPPIEELSANLRRLHSRLEATENWPGPEGKGLKLRAVRTAYVDALSRACEQLEVDPPPRGPRGDMIPQQEIYRVEAALRQRGLDVRERAA